MKANESNISIERGPREEELPELAVRVLSDFARIVAAETRLLESNIVVAAQTLLDRVYIASTLIVLAAAGVVPASQPRTAAASVDALVAGARTGRRMRD